MRKIASVFVLIFLGFALSTSGIRAEQYDNLVQLPLDQNQAEVIDDQVGGEVLGTQTTKAMVSDKSVLDVTTVDAGPHFFYGEEQVIDENLVGDVYVFAGKVEINGNIDGDLMVLGGTVVLNGDVTQDVRAGAGTIYVNGQIGQNLTVGAGQIYFGEKALIGNSVVAAGGDVNLDGQTTGKVLLGGGAARLAGKYGSDVHAQADTFKVMPGVVVAGSLIADAYTSADVAPDAQVMKENMVKVVPPEQKNRPQREEKMRSVGGVLVKAVMMEFLFKLLIGFVSGSILIYFLPKLVKAAKNQVLLAPMANFGWGLVYLFMTPIVILLTLVSVVAMPIAGLLVLIYLGSMMVAHTVVAVALGDKLVHGANVKMFKNPYLSFGVGLLVLRLVCFLPLLGWMVGFVSFTIGMGTLFILMKSYLAERK
ncbi:hypothetical protein KJZ63_02690 [Patescibacteria group bacterium]|nr:hypothetical protein [Patescibacteria group bacterium]